MMKYLNIRIIILVLFFLIEISHQGFAVQSESTVESVTDTDSVVDNEGSLALRKIMHDLGNNMQGITDGISREDWVLVKNNASKIAEHPTPPFFEKLRILSYVGSDIGQYKNYDSKTHNAALELVLLAADEDAYGVITAFSTLQNTCLACHQEFRKSFKQHFYKLSEY